MKSSIEKLYAISQKETRLIIGLMSGTSLDGLDIALCQFQNDAPVSLLRFETVSYQDDFKEEIRKVFARDLVSLPHLTLLHPWVAEVHAEMILTCLQKWQIEPSEIDLIASHGQTVMHMPKRLHGLSKFSNATLQIGDGDHLAVKTGITTVSDFRQKHIALGGEGAPLALMGDLLLFQSPTEDRILINIGGIANFTYLPASIKEEHAYATDTGPGNTLIDAYVWRHWQLPFDKDAALALQGNLIPELLETLLLDPYFEEKAPKTTGPEKFNLQMLDKHCKSSYHPNDILCTLCHFTAHSLADEIRKISGLNTGTCFYLSGGGAHNPLIIDVLKSHFPQNSFQPMQALGIDGDAKEAVLFAALANYTVADNYTKLGNSLGKISFP